MPPGMPESDSVLPDQSEDRSLHGQDAGSPSTGEPVFLVIGKLHRPHGVKGEIVMEIITDFPERLRPGVVVYLGEQRQPLTITRKRPHQQALLLSFQGYDTPESVGELRNELLYVRTEDRPPLAEGEYYHHQMLGLRVISDEGEFLGILTQILDNPANDIYVVQPESGDEILLPAIEDVILNVDLSKRELHVHLLPGLRPD